MDEQIITQMSFINFGQVHIWFRTSADAMLLVRRRSASQISWQPLLNLHVHIYIIYITMWYITYNWNHLQDMTIVEIQAKIHLKSTKSSCSKLHSLLPNEILHRAWHAMWKILKWFNDWLKRIMEGHWVRIVFNLSFQMDFREFNIKKSIYQNRNSPHINKTVSQPFRLYNGLPYTSRAVSLIESALIFLNYSNGGLWL